MRCGLFPLLLNALSASSLERHEERKALEEDATQPYVRSPEGRWVPKPTAAQRQQAADQAAIAAP